MLKRISALLLALVLAFLCACSGAGGSTTPGADGSQGGASGGQPAPPWQDELLLRIHTASNRVPPAPDDSVRTWYEVFVYSFCDSDGDGVGDLPGLTSMLDYVEYLGFNGIWLMPIHPSPTYHKYDVTDYYAIDPQYGTLEDFDAFLAGCEARGIRVILDLVLNHTSVEHPWFTGAVQALRDGNEDDPLVGYYHFEKREPGGSWYRATGEWCYEAMFWSGMPDLNLESDALWEEIAAITQFWLDRGVAGFRLDAVKEFVSGNAAANIAILQRLNALVKGQNPDAYLVGENWDTSDGMYQYYQSGIDSLFAYPFGTQSGYIAQTLLQTDRTALFFAERMLAAQQLLEQNSLEGAQSTGAPFFINHDNARAAGFLKRDPALIKTAWGMNLMMNGNAFVYYGEELGMSGSGKDENKRAPMLWTDEARADGMAIGPSGMESVTHSFAPAVQQLADLDSILRYVQHAIAVRNSYPAIARGEMEIIPNSGSPDVAAVAKTWGEERVVLVYNLTDAEQTVQPAQDAPGWTELLDALCAAGGEVALAGGGALTLPPYTIAVLK